MKTILKAILIGLSAVSLTGCCTSQGLNDDEQCVHIRPDLPGQMLPSHDSSSPTEQRLSLRPPLTFRNGDVGYDNLPFQFEDSCGRSDTIDSRSESNKPVEKHPGWELLGSVLEAVLQSAARGH